MIPIITASILIIVGIIFAVRLRIIKKKKRKYTREPFALAVTRLICDIVLFAIAAITPSLSFWDVIMGVVNPAYAENDTITLVSRGLIFLLVVIAVTVIMTWAIRIHKNWDGAKSKRQFRFDSYSNLDDSYQRRLKLLFEDAFAQLFHKKHSEELKLHGSTDFALEESLMPEKENPWHVEFATIYSILNSRVSITIERDWHSQENCFITPFNDKSIVILVSDDFPVEKKIEGFLSYIRRIGCDCFSVIIAVRNNPRNLNDQIISLSDTNIEVKFKNNLLDNLVDFSGYFDSIKRQMREPITPDTTLSISDVYTPLYCKKHADPVPCVIDEYIDEWLSENSQRQLAILGDFGQGKTVSSLKLTERLINENSNRIPILIKLRGKSPRNSSPIEILSYFSAQYGLNPHALQILNTNGRLLLILDGFDEMDYVGDWSIRKLHFRSIWKLASKNTKIMLTGRDNYFFDAQEALSALGGDINSKDIPHCDTIKLCMFTSEQIKDALRNTEADIKSGISRVLDSSPSTQFVDLISRPSQLFLITQIWKVRKLEDKYKNLSAASVINEFLLENFERQLKKSTETSYSVLSPIEREYFMLGIALRMYAMQINEIDKEMLVDTIKELVDVFPDSISKSSPALLNIRNGKSLRGYYYEEQHTREAILMDIRVCGVLIRDEARDKFVFAHKSFLDLLVAKCFYGKYLPSNDNYNVISRMIFSLDNIKLRSIRRNDFTQKKLLAELITQSVGQLYSAKNDLSNAEILFAQCYRFIVSNFDRRVTPIKIFRKYCKRTEMDNELINRDDLQQKRKFISGGETLRLMVIPFVLLPSVIIMFIVRGLSIYFNMHNIALENIATFNTLKWSNLSMDSNTFSPLFNWLFFSILVVIIILIIISRIIGKYFRIQFIQKTEIVLFTWYYACQNAGISQAEILQCFPRKDAKQFLEFISTLKC